MISKYDAVLFDFDGTVADTGKGIFSSIQYAVECLGFEPLDNETLRRFIGPPVFDSFRREFGIDEEKCRFAVKKYREKYAESGIFQFEIYEGIPELFKTLHDSKYLECKARDDHYGRKRDASKREYRLVELGCCMLATARHEHKSQYYD